MAFTLPDNDEAFNTNQSIWMQTDINAIIAAINGDGVVSGCAVSEDGGGASMDLDVAAGIIQIAGVQYAIAGGLGALTVTAADGANPRIDLVCANIAGAVTLTDGTAAANPKAADIPATSVLLAMVYVPANDTTIADNQITDKRVIVPNNRGEIFLPAPSGWPSTTDGCADAVKMEYATNDQDLYSLDFDASANEYAQWSVWMPDTWNAGTITFAVVWTAASGTLAATYEWNLQATAYANDDPIDVAWGSAVEIEDALITLEDIHYTVESGALTVGGTPVAGELVQFRAFRDAINDSGDSDGKLIGIKIYYTKA